MKHRIETTDNNYGQNDVRVDGESTEALNDDVLAALSPFSGVELSVLGNDNPGLFVFPRSAGGNEDEIGSNCLYSLPGGRLVTHNVAGVIGFGKGDERVTVSIRSRFDRDESKQYFLNAMLKQVFGINLLNLNVSSGEERIWDILPYLFPYCLNEALSQGTFRAYRGFQQNDCDLRGTVDVSRHIVENIPFRGSVAYEVREHTENNAVVQLVRHALEHINGNPDMRHILYADETIRRNVMLIRSVTPDYERRSLRQVLQRNLRPICHPYYTKWGDLQRLCVRILQHDKLSFDGKGEGIHGIVFDVAWLWEEYLAKELKKLGFVHAENKTKRNPLSLFADGYSVYPDFRDESRGIVLDAKYKRLDGAGIAREDLYQMISYIHIMPEKNGWAAVLLYPSNRNPNDVIGGIGPEIVGVLNGYGGRILKQGFFVPSSAGACDFTMYESLLAISMRCFIDDLKKGVLS